MTGGNYFQQKQWSDERKYTVVSQKAGCPESYAHGYTSSGAQLLAMSKARQFAGEKGVVTFNEKTQKYEATSTRGDFAEFFFRLT